MIRKFFWFSVLFAVLAAGSERAEAQLDSLAWLAACWQGSHGSGRTVTEQWMQPLGNTMIGMSLFLQNSPRLLSL